MILIADSGSTKTDWRLIRDNSEVSSFSTIGFNPYIIDEKAIIQELVASDLSVVKHEIKEVFFYGAGCSTDKNNNIVLGALTSFFINASVDVNHDMLAAARAACSEKGGMVAILGTGSNSCLFNGKEIIENISALGYILGDYGSGADIGKSFIKAYLEKELPKEIATDFFKQNQLSATDILDAVYKKELPNRFLANFSQFVYQNIQHPYMIALVKARLVLFFEKNICKYSNFKSHKLHLVGSVAFVYQDLIRDAAKQYNVEIDKIIKQPIDGLVTFHLEKNQ